MFKKLRVDRHGKQDVIAFVDYEHWYYSYRNLYNMKPNIEEWYEEISEDYNLRKLMIFGDFSERGIGYELSRLENITADVINTTSTKEGVDKDFTDFIMLDYMYQAAVSSDSPDNIILFTGDGHFDSVVKYLRKTLHKKVIVYGVKKAFSGKLKSIASSYVDMPRYVQKQQFFYNLILESLENIEKKPDKNATYWKTVKLVSEYSKVSEDNVQVALDELINQKYIEEKEEMHRCGTKMRVLNVYWDRLAKDGIWSLKKTVTN